MKKGTENTLKLKEKILELYTKDINATDENGHDAAFIAMKIEDEKLTLNILKNKDYNIQKILTLKSSSSKKLMKIY